MTSRSGFDLEFSLTHAPPVRCDRGDSCHGSQATKGIYPAGTPLYETKLKRNKTKLNICASCFDHYRSKSSTQVTQSVQPPARGRLGGRVVKGDAQIHALTAAAQRHEKVEVRAIGNGACSTSSGPRVAHTSGGYTANHNNYSVALNQNRNRSLLHGGLTGAVTGRLAYLPPRGKKLQPFETCQVTIPDVPVSIGASVFLDQVFNELLPSYQSAIKNLCFTKGISLSDNIEIYPLSTDDILMVNDDAVPYNMTVELNLIRAHFFKTTKEGSALVFNPKAKPAVVQLQLTSTWYSRYLHWLSDLEQKQIECDEAAEFGIKRKSSSSVGPRKRGKMETLYADITSVTTGSAGSASAKSMTSAQDGLNSFHAPTLALTSTILPLPSELARALSLATKTNTEDTRPFVQFRTFDVVLRKIKFMSLSSLTRSMISQTRLERFEDEAVYTLTVDYSNPSVGGFKTAHKGRVEASPFCSKTVDVCVKQGHQFDKNSHKTISHPSRVQLTFLTDELLTHQWANALLDATYAHVTAVRQKLFADNPTWKPRLKVPELRFTEAGLAIEQGEASRAKVYMMEEYISGPFKKYIHNGSVQPLSSVQNDPVAIFLAFSQHAQYVLSNGLAFVSDYQGGPRDDHDETVILTDPQLITNPDLGDIFAGGNIPAAFHNFCEQHVCNSFCRDFQLTPLSDFIPTRLESRD
ncbi:hypothetical protein B0H14DRAFT_2642830 [Mycena olivaceomarginata]|nr:hypothetical protein B0H14DRAFT_2642830 [Mycena olivaceomarginata]